MTGAEIKPDVTDGVPITDEDGAWKHAHAGLLIYASFVIQQHTAPMLNSSGRAVAPCAVSLGVAAGG